MALTFIREDNMPTYLCLSTDIVDQKIEGASLVGKTVLATDTGSWYVIEKDLTLSSYSLPINLSSEVTIGSVNQGNAGISRWLVDASQADGDIFDINIAGNTETIPVTIADSAANDAFSRTRVSLPNTIFNSSFVYDLDTLAFEQITALGGSIAHAPLVSSANLTIGITSGSRAAMTSRKYFRYVPAKSQLIAMTQVFGAGVTNIRKRAGYFDDNNGIFFEQDATTDVAVCLRSSTSGSPVDTRVVQANWNLDKLNGTGASGLTLDVTKATILIIDYQWLGMGRVRIGFDIDGVIHYAHQFLNANNLSVPYMQTGTLPVRWEIVSYGVSAGSNMYATCSAVLSEGGETEPGAYDFSVSNTTAISATTSRTPILAIRPTALYNSKTNRIDIKINGFSGLAGTNDVIFELVYNPTITTNPGISWAQVNDRSGVEYHQDITNISGGYVLETEFCPSSASSKGTISGTMSGRLPIVLDNAGSNPIPLVLCAKSIASTSSCFGAISWTEGR